MSRVGRGVPQRCDDPHPEHRAHGPARKAPLQVFAVVLVSRATQHQATIVLRHQAIEVRTSGQLKAASC